MTGFAADWLRLREAFDAAARSVDLARRFSAALCGYQSAPRRIIDLASGTGANFRALAPLIAGDQDWLLIDHDPALLAAQAREIGHWAQRQGWQCSTTHDGVLIEVATARWQVRAQQLDLARSLERIDFAACDGVTTAAFFDLVSADWLDRLSNALAHHSLKLLAVLTVDGRRKWHPYSVVDTRIDEAFTQHQTSDKGFGGALGAKAVNYLADSLAARGYKISMERSDWRIGAEHGEMLLQMANESAAVARTVMPQASALFAEWCEERASQIRSGLLSLEIGHIDLLGVPEQISSMRTP